LSDVVSGIDKYRYSEQFDHAFSTRDRQRLNSLDAETIGSYLFEVDYTSYRKDEDCVWGQVLTQILMFLYTRRTSKRIRTNERNLY
jgi:hypothetical protein